MWNGIWHTVELSMLWFLLLESQIDLTEPYATLENTIFI